MRSREAKGEDAELWWALCVRDHEGSTLSHLHEQGSAPSQLTGDGFRA